MIDTLMLNEIARRIAAHGRPRYQPEPTFVSREAAQAFFATHPAPTPEQCQAFCRKQVSDYLAQRRAVEEIAAYD
jgi:hypothetical protein